MVGGEAVRLGVLGELRQPQGHRVPDQLSEEPVPAGQRPDLGPPLLVDTDGDERGQLPVSADHTQGAVLGIHQDHRDLDDAAQHLGQVQLPSDGQDGLQQAVQAVPGATDGVDAYLQLAQQFVETELGQMLLGSPTRIRAHRFLRPIKRTRPRTSSPALTVLPERPRQHHALLRRRELDVAQPIGPPSGSRPVASRFRSA